jgi:hypothetical protein
MKTSIQETLDVPIPKYPRSKPPPARMSLSDSSLEPIDSDIPGNFTASPTFTVTDLLTSLGDRTQDGEYLVTKGNDLVLLLQKFPYIKEDLILSAFGHRLQNLLTHQKKEVVATGYRICRYVVFDATSIQALITLKLDVLIIITLAKGAHYNVEREQALKLLRKFIDIPGGSEEITRGLANAVLAIAEQVDDRMRKISIETACEICMLRPDLIRPQALLQFILDGPYELSSMCATVILNLLNGPKGRKYVTTADIQRLISPFTEFPVKGHLNNERLQTSAHIISRFMKNLAGFHGLCLDDYEPLKELVGCLSFPVNGFVSKLLDLFLDVLLIKPLSKKSSTHSSKTVLVPLKLENEFVLSNHYLSLVVVVLVKCDLINQLLQILQNTTDESNCTKAGFILTEIANIKYNLVPDELFIAASDEVIRNYDKTTLDITRAEHTIEKLTRKSNKGRRNYGVNSFKIQENFISNSKVSRTKVSYNIDELKLKQMINETRVASTKNFLKWDCELLTELFDGPLMNGKRLDEINRTTKFLKRLLSFYRPFKHKFSGTKKSKSTLRFIKLGCDILNCLLNSQEGIRILNENKIIPQIAECLAQLDPYSGLYAKDQIFSKERLETTLTSGYFKMLGVVASHQNGIKLLEQWKLVSIMHHISDDPFRRDDLIILFMNEMNYGRPGQLRVLLSKFLHSENMSVKRNATNLLKGLISEEETTEFACEMLIEQLYEQDEEICSIVISILADYCEDSVSHMDRIIKLAPSISILRLSGEVGESLLMKFLSTPIGYEYLQSRGFIDEEFENWVSGERYLSYALDVEKLLMKMDHDWDYESICKRPDLPLNLFGELVKTEEGFNIIVHSGIMTEFVNMIRYYATSLGRSRKIQIDLLKLKACLWSIGLISTSDLGIETLDVNGCIEDIVQIATQSPLLDLRGIAFYVLGLISKTMQGAEVLDEYGWSSKMNIYQQPIGLTLPSDVQRFIGFKEDEQEAYDVIDFNVFDELNEEDQILRKLMLTVSNLCNHVYLNSASKDLVNFSKQHPECFEDPDVFYLVLQCFEMYKYRQTIRKFIIETFTASGRLLGVIVKRDKRRMKELLGH